MIERKILGGRGAEIVTEVGTADLGPGTAIDGGHEAEIERMSFHVQ